jgi:hypothetical protein
MKNIYGLFFLLALLLMGCSSTYTIKDFPSKEKFYEDFNNSAQNKDVNVTLINDSSFAINDGIILENDTLFSLEGKDNRSFALSDITEIRYKNNDYSSASILFKNGDILRGKDIRTDSDSIYFTVKTSKAKNNIASIHIAVAPIHIAQDTLFTPTNVFPIETVKSVSYKTYLRSVPLGILSGAIAGLIIAVIAGNNLTSKDDSGAASAYYILAPPIGAMVGAIVGGCIGWKTIYQFNP